MRPSEALERALARREDQLDVWLSVVEEDVLAALADEPLATAIRWPAYRYAGQWKIWITGPVLRVLVERLRAMGWTVEPYQRRHWFVRRDYLRLSGWKPPTCTAAEPPIPVADCQVHPHRDLPEVCPACGQSRPRSAS